MSGQLGKPILRKEDPALLSGRGRYADDLAVPVGTLHAHVVRSPHAHATIKSIDAKAASRMPGVVAIFTGADVAADKIGGHICGWTVHSKDGSPT